MKVHNVTADGPAEPERRSSRIREGLLRRDFFDPDASAVWHIFRVTGGLASAAICFFLAALWGWAGGLIVGAVALGVSMDGALRLKGWLRPSVFQSVVIDVSLIGAAITLLDIDVAGVSMPLVYMAAMAFLLLPTIEAFIAGSYAVLWALLALATDTPFPTPESVTTAVVSTITWAVFAVLLVSMVAVLARSLGRARLFSDQRLREEMALVIAGNELLSHTDDGALSRALGAIREATGAEAAFVAENSGDRKTGPAAVVRQVSAADDSVGATSWTLPYLKHRDAARALANGESVRLDDALSLVLESEPGSVAALAVPISVRGEWAGFLGIAHDVEIASICEPNLHVLETIAAMIGSFIERQKAYDRLEQLVASKDQFLASISHEIRTPLTSVLGFASVLRKDPDSLEGDEGSELVALIEQQAQEATDLVEDLLVAARAEIDALAVTKEPVSLSAEITKVLKARLGTEEQDIFVAASPSHRALADPTRVRQIIRNLLTNALRYGGDEITITTHRDGPDVTLVFSDNGDGIPPEYRRRIFDPYYRGKPGLSKPESIGLGLAVSRQLARLMDGDLTLRSDVGPATFQLMLPMAPKDDVAADAPVDGATLVGSEVHVSLSTLD